jgi:prevent-host-death family protein
MTKTARNWSVQDARARFSEVIDAALRGQPQRVARRGKDAVVVVSEAEWNRRPPSVPKMTLGEFLATYPLAPEDVDLAATRIGNVPLGKLDDRVKDELRTRAASKGVSLEEEALDILTAAVDRDRTPETNLADLIAGIMEPLGGVELDLPPRTPHRELFQFDDCPDEDQRI